MPSHRRSLPAAVLLACCVLALLALAPLAAPSGAGRSTAPSAAPTFDDAETRRLLAEERAREERRARERDTLEAKRRRVGSRTRFRGLGARDAAALARDEFASLFDGPDGELLDLEPGQRVVRYVGENGAVVDSGAGGDSLVTSTLPMRARDESGRLRPVDLGLEASGAGFEPRNPVAPMRIQRDPARALTVDGAFTLGDPGAAGGQGFLVGNNVFYGEVAAETDMWLTPRPEGAELSWQLRSYESPETLTADFDLPPGTSLRETGDGSVDVMRDGKAIASVAAPVAWDATDEEVPTSQRVAGDRIVISAPHRDRDVEYPIAVDPVVWAYNMRDWGLWPPHNYVYEQSGGADFSHYFSNDSNVSFWGRGMYVRRRSGVWYPSGSWGQYVYRAFRQSFIQNMQYANVTHRGPSTHITVGIWGGNAYQNWESRDTFSHNFDNWTSTRYTGGVTGNMGVFAVGAPNGGTVTLRSGSPYYEGSGYIGGATSWESDGNAPSIGVVHDETPAGWVHSAQPLVGWDARDAGLGTKLVRIVVPGYATDDRWHGCAGTPNDRCPDFWGTHWFRYDTNAMPEGRHWVRAASMDVIDRWSPSGVGPTVNVDRSAPTISLSGDLATRDGQLLTGESYALTASATDRWSGVGDIRIIVNGVDQGNGPSCSTENCTVQRPFTFRPAEGLNTIVIRARDRINHWAPDRTIRVVSDRQKPSASVSHSGLDLGWVDAASVETTVSATDSGAGVKRAVVAWPGGERTKSFPNADTCTGAVASRCPSSGSTTIAYGSADLADGINTIRGTAVDAAQRASDEHTWQVSLDRGNPQVTQSGSLYDRRGQEVPDGVYTVHADGADGDASSDATARSGVVHVELRLDGEVQEERDLACATHSCALSLDWAVDTALLSAGTHRVDVLARDRLGHEGADSFTFTKACCAALPTYSAWTVGAPRFGDVNGDGRADAVGRDALGLLHVALANGEGFDASAPWGQGPLTDGFEVADANADGAADVLWADATGELRVALSDGASFGVAATWGSAPLGDEVRFADVDADEQADAVLHDGVTGAVSVAYSEGSGFEPALQWTLWDAAYDLSLADVTGDGAADAVGRNADGDVRVAVSDAGSFGAATSWGTRTAEELAFADVDGDGLADAVTRDPETGAVEYGSSDGGSFGAAKPFGTWSVGPLDSADVTGDDLDDLAGYDAVAGRLVVAASTAETPLGPEADVDPADSAVEVEEDVLAPPPAPAPGTQTLSAAAAPSASTTTPRGKPRIAMQDDSVLVGRDDFDRRQLSDAEIDHVYRRLREAGVTVVRFNAYWGGIENRPAATPGTYEGGERYTWAPIDRAVEAARRHGMYVHLTFTGLAHSSSSECSAMKNGNGIGCHADGRRNPTGVLRDDDGPKRAAFGEFVEEGVRRYTRDDAGHPSVDVKSFAIWNEPNLWAWLAEGNKKKIVPTRMYRLLYTHGYNGWRRATAAVESTDPAVRRDAVTGTQMLIGELSSGPRSGVSEDRPGCAGPRKCSWTSMQFLEWVVRGGSSIVRASGLAYHPYQDWNRPDRQSARYDFQGNKRPGTNRELGIGRLGDVQRALRSLCDPEGSACGGRLRAPDADRRVGLYLTEFGYHNQPTDKKDDDRRTSPKRNRYWHTEQTRANWFAGTKSYDGALDNAVRSTAKWMVLYHALEDPPEQCVPGGRPLPPEQTCDPPAPGENEYGLFDLPRPTWPGWTPGDDIVGVRQYGKDHEWRPTTFGRRSPRKAYCAIRRWVIEAEYFGDTFPAELRNRCPAPAYAHDED